MDATVQVAIATGIATIISVGFNVWIAPRINWGIEKKKVELKYKHELIAKWRAMLAEAARQELENDDTKLLMFLERHIDFYSLTNHIPNDKNVYEMYRKRHASISTPVFLRYLIDEIARIEKEWELV